MDGGADAVVREQLRAAYADYCKAVVAQDLTNVFGHMADMFCEVSATGAVFSRAQVHERMRLSLSAEARIGPAQVTIESLDLAGDRAVATIRRLILETRPDWIDPTKQSDTFLEERLRDTWHAIDGVWTLERTEHLDLGAWGMFDPAPEAIASPLLAELAVALEAGEPGALDAFWSRVEGRAPLVEPIAGDGAHVLVTFLWRAGPDTHDVALTGGLPALPEEKPLRRLGATDVWYRTERVPSTARDSYGFIVHGTMTDPRAATFKAERTDPRNPASIGAQSWFELPAAPAQPYVTERQGVPRGTLVHERMTSTILGEERTYAVHVPSGVDAQSSGLGLLVIFDGQTHGSAPDAAVPAPLIVDNLIAAGRIQPLVVLLVDNPGETRSRDLPCHGPFFEFLARELVPHVRARYRLSSDPRLTVVAGSSFGGLAATYAGLRHSDVFGNVLSQSGSYWYAPDWKSSMRTPHAASVGWMMGAIASAPTLPVRFWMEVGRFEHPRMVLTNRHLRSVLELKGYPVTYSEYDGGHSYACWRGSLADGLITLLGETAAVESRPHLRE